MKRLVRALTAAIAALCLILPCSALEELPAPEWVKSELSGISQQTVTVDTPTYLLESIDRYEYSFDSFQTYRTMPPSGGELLVTSSCELSLRYYVGETVSPVYTLKIEISTVKPITSSAGVTLLLDESSPVPSSVSLSAYEIVSGTDVTRVLDAVGENKSVKLLYVTLMLGSQSYTPSEELNWLFPVGDFDIEYCLLYHISKNYELTQIDSSADLNVLAASSEKTGLFAVVEDKTYMKGDVNGDASITAGDARLALRASAQLEQLGEKGEYAADFDGSGNITASDARAILRTAAKLPL